MGAIVECVPCGGLLAAGTVGLIGELPETGMTNKTTLLSSYEFMLFYIAGNSPFNLRGHSYWRRAKATRFYQDDIRKDLFRGLSRLFTIFTETIKHLQWGTKILWTVIENLPSTSVTYQIFRCSIICPSLIAWIPRIALPSPLQTMLGWRNTFSTGWSVQGCTNWNTAWGERERGKIEADRVNCPKNLDLHCCLTPPPPPIKRKKINT